MNLFPVLSVTEHKLYIHSNGCAMNIRLSTVLPVSTYYWPDFHYWLTCSTAVQQVCAGGEWAVPARWTSGG